MIHHIPYPMKFFKEMNRILKKNGKLIIFEPYCSVLLQLATTIMKHEGFDFTVNVWDEKKPKSDEKNVMKIQGKSFRQPKAVRPKFD